MFSPGYSTMLGYDPEGFARSYKTWTNLVHPDNIHRVKQHHADHFAGRTDFSIEFRMREKAGNCRWIHSRGILIERDAEGKPLRMVWTHSDIQQRKSAEEALREAHKALLRSQRIRRGRSRQSAPNPREVTGDVSAVACAHLAIRSTIAWSRPRL